MSSTALKAQFDSLGKLLVERLNLVIDALQVISGAGEIGARVDGLEANTVAKALSEIYRIAKDKEVVFDTTPTKGSSNAVTSDGIYQALQDISVSGGILVDSVLQDSPNPVKNSAITAALAEKVDKVSGKGLSTNDFTAEDKAKLDEIERLVKDVTILATDWTSTENESYQALVSVEGILASDTPHIGLKYQGEKEGYLAEITDYGKISYAISTDEQILFVCLEDMPTVNLHLQIEVVR